MLERREEVAYLRMRGAAGIARKLHEHADMARLSRRLTGIAVDAPVPQGLGDYARRSPDEAAISALFDRLKLGPMTRSRVRALG